MTSTLCRSAEHEAVGGQQPRPQQQRSFLAGPERGELVGSGQRAVGMMEDVGDGEVVGEGGLDQCEGRAGDGKKAADAGAPGGLSQTLGGDAAAGANRQLPQRECRRPAECSRSERERGGGRNFQRPA